MRESPAHDKLFTPPSSEAEPAGCISWLEASHKASDIPFEISVRTPGGAVAGGRFAFRRPISWWRRFGRKPVPTFRRNAL